MIERIINVKKEIKKGKVLIIYGSRQVGKTTLIKNFLSKTSLNYKFVSGDDIQLASELSKCTMKSTTNFVGDYELIVIDEAQKIQNIGLALKLMVDNYPNKYYIATGSSSFDLASKTAESLTGRKILIELYPISQQELLKNSSKSELQIGLESYLIYGSYPEVIKQKTFAGKERVLREIANSYLLRDILQFQGIKNSVLVLKILKLLALQVGSEVSAVEIAKSVGVDYKTVNKYLELLEKSFIIFSLTGFSRNLRKEVNKMPKYYFFDTGIRNALISNFNALEDRSDVGKLWENFLLIERMKKHSYEHFSTNYYFWRTYDQKEIDLVEENSGKLFGFEFKWQDKKVKAPRKWIKSYENASFEVVNKENYFDFVV